MLLPAWLVSHRRSARVVAAVLVLAALAGCRHASAPPAEGALDPADRPESQSWDARLRATADGRPTLEIDAPYLARFDRPDSAYVFLGPPPTVGDSAGAVRADTSGASRVSVRLFDAAGAASATVEADRAWFYESERRLVAEGRVVATVADARVEAPRLTTTGAGAFTATGGATVQLTGRANARVRARTVSGGGGRYEASGGATVEAGSGRRLDSSRVVWDDAAGRFTAPGAFSFDGPGERVRGVGLSATADLSRYSFRRATGEIEVQE